MLWFQWGILYQTGSNCVIGFISLFNKLATVILSSIPFHCCLFLFIILGLIDTGFVSLLCYIVTWNVIILNLFATYFKCVVCVCVFLQSLILLYVSFVEFYSIFVWCGIVVYFLICYPGEGTRWVFEVLLGQVKIPYLLHRQICLKNVPTLLTCTEESAPKMHPSL